MFTFVTTVNGLGVNSLSSSFQSLQSSLYGAAVSNGATRERAQIGVILGDTQGCHVVVNVGLVSVDQVG